MEVEVLYRQSKGIREIARDTGVARNPWFNKTLTAVNDAVVRLGIFEGEFPWDKQDDQDEFFYFFGASHSSILVPSGSTTDANFPYGVASRS